MALASVYSLGFLSSYRLLTHEGTQRRIRLVVRPPPSRHTTTTNQNMKTVNLVEIPLKPLLEGFYRVVEHPPPVLEKARSQASTVCQLNPA